MNDTPPKYIANLQKHFNGVNGQLTVTHGIPLNQFRLTTQHALLETLATLIYCGENNEFHKSKNRLMGAALSDSFGLRSRDPKKSRVNSLFLLLERADWTMEIFPDLISQIALKSEYEHLRIENKIIDMPQYTPAEESYPLEELIS